MTKPSVSVVIPCYRTGARVERLIDEISASLTSAGYLTFEIVMVVDGSPDDTWSRVARAAEQDSRVRGILLMRNYGQHSALLAGVRAAIGEAIVTLDDDFQHRPEDIHLLLDRLNAETDLVYGNSIDEEHSFLRNLASNCYKWIAQTLLGLHNAQALSAFRAFRRDLVDGFEFTEDPYAPLDVLLSWSTQSIATVPVRMQERTDGESNYTFRRLVRHAANAITGYSIAPLRMVTALGLATFGLALILLIVVVVKYLRGSITVVGYPSLVVMITLFSGIQLLTLGIIGEYIGRLHTRSMGKPRYVVRFDTQSSR